MKARTLGIWPLLAIALVPAETAGQQAQTRMGGLVLSAWAGGAANTDLQRARARAEWQASAGNLISREFTRHVRPESSVAFALGVAWWFNPSWGIRLQTGVSPSQLEVSVSERETSGIPADTGLTTPRGFGSLRVWTGDLVVLLRAPFTPRDRVAPYGFLGAGRVRYQVSTVGDLPPEAASFEHDNRPTRTAGVVGLGAMVPLQRGPFAISFELSAHVLETPLGKPAQRRLMGEEVELITPLGPENDVHFTTYVRLLVGLSVLARTPPESAER